MDTPSAAHGSSQYALADPLPGVAFTWQLATAPGIAHSGQNMSPVAARLLFE